MKNWRLFVASGAVVALWLAWVFQVPIIKSTRLFWRPEILGQWGDTFGALNALFAAAAFIGVLWTLSLQREQLNEQKIELERQKQRQADQEILLAQEKDATRKAEHLQKFENTFFQLLALLREVRAEVRYRSVRSPGSDLSEGSAAFAMAWDDAQAVLRGTRPEPTSEEVGDIYSVTIHARAESGLGPYFRLIYTILERISSDPLIPNRERVRYSRLLRSQLTSPEVGLLALNGLTDAAKDLDRYLTRFHMLKYLPEDAARRELMRHYPEKAFAPRPDRA